MAGYLTDTSLRWTRRALMVELLIEEVKSERLASENSTKLDQRNSCWNS